LTIATNAAISGVQVTYGVPGPDEAPEAVWLDNVVNLTDEASHHQVSHRESFIVPIVVSILRADRRDHQAAEERAWAVAGPIEDAVRAHPDLSGAAGVTAALVTGKSVDSYSDDGGVIVEIVITVTVRSKI
jgi:hypothetical protein